jgi:hypothetical protein
MKWTARLVKQLGVKQLVVECDHAQDARSVVAVIWNVEPGNIQIAVASEFEATSVDIELKWQGSDYHAGGSPNGRSLFIRERKGEAWTEWEKALT